MDSIYSRKGSLRYRQPWTAQQLRDAMSMLEPDGLGPNDLLFDGLDEERNRGILAGLVSSAKAGNLTGLVILSIVVSAIVLVLLACYLMMRFMHKALSGGDGKGDMASPYSNVVMHSKRVYEIQAEEGCFNGEQEDDNSSPQEETPSTEDDGVSRSSLRRPETGDLRQIRMDETTEDDPRMMVRKKEKKVHKDSVCAFLFRPQPVPKAV